MRPSTGFEGRGSAAPITVVDPDTHFSDANIYCFANFAGSFQGCPLDTNSDGTCDVQASNCLVTQDFDVALEGDSNCDFDGTPGRRCLFRGGDTFTVDVERMGS